MATRRQFLQTHTAYLGPPASPALLFNTLSPPPEASARSIHPESANLESGSRWKVECDHQLFDRRNLSHHLLHSTLPVSTLNINAQKVLPQEPLPALDAGRHQAVQEGAAMNQLRVAHVSEDDFDQMIILAGGHRTVADPSIESNPNADYSMAGAFLELKLLEEEGLEKHTRRQKIARLFRSTQPENPVVIIDPTLLDSDCEAQYFGIMAGPVHTAVKTAAKQLDSSRQRAGGTETRILIAINNGYTSLSPEEFKRIVLKAAQNDTHCIDSVIVGGIYYWSDGIDSYVVFPLEEHPINAVATSPAFLRLKEQWDNYSERVMNSLFRGDDPSHKFNKMPIVDITFDIESVTYVKPAEPFGEPSDFWIHGRPRQNSTGVEVCPPIARTFPDMDAATWEMLRDTFPSSSFFCQTYPRWIHFRDSTLERDQDPRKPTVPIRVTREGVLEWCQQSRISYSMEAVFAYAAHLFEQRARALMLEAKSHEDTLVFPTKYILAKTQEIGHDCANDFSSIYLVREGVKGPTVKVLMRPERIFHEHAIALAAAYALKTNAEVILYARNQTYAWV